MAFDDIDVVCTKSAFESFSYERDAIGKYHSLIVVGGDGSFNTAVNALANQKDAPILGYINSGTLGDVGKNFGVGKNLKKSLRLIAKGQSAYFDLGELNGRYFAYMAALGRYADISYAVSKPLKKRFGKYSYYLQAMKEAVGDRELCVKIKSNGETWEATYPFVLILNGHAVGGIKVNRKGKMDDGKMECFLTDPGSFGGLFHYFTKRDIDVFEFEEIEVIPIGEEAPWCLDGEMGPSGPAKIRCAKAAIRCYFRG